MSHIFTENISKVSKFYNQLIHKQYYYMDSSFTKKNTLINSFDSEPQITNPKKKSQSIDRQFQMLLKKSNYPYLSKLTIGRKRFFSNKRDRIENSEPSIQINLNQPSKSQSKAKNRYNNKATIINDQKVPKKKFFFIQEKQVKQEVKTITSSVKQPSLNNRSYFLKKLKQRYQNKNHQTTAQKSQLKIASQKATLLQQNPIQKELRRQFDQNTQQEQNQIKILTPLDVLEEYNSYLTEYQRETQIKSFTHIYYFGISCLSKQRKGIDNHGHDDDQGGYIWLQKDHIAYRFQMLAMLGEGSFGQVFKCYDHRDKVQIALKMVRNRKKYNKQAQTQIFILKYIKENDPNMNKNLTQIKEHFIFRQHTCMVFELLSINLYELIKLNDYYGLPLDLIRRFSLQILNGLHFLHKHQIIHADLKPENILLKQSNKSGLKIIDFGSSCFIKQRIYTYIQSRYYRAPQVILGIPYDYKIDIWSFACIITELYLGYPILPGQNQKEQIWLIMEMIGMPSRKILQNSTRRHHYFNEKFQPQEYTNSKGTKYQLLNNPLAKVIQSKDCSFRKFLERLFLWDPQQRLTPLQCLKHEWILEGLPEEIKKQHMKFIQQEEQLLKVERRKRSPKPKQFKIEQISPSRQRKQFSQLQFDNKKKRLPSIQYRKSKFYKNDI